MLLVVSNRGHRHQGYRNPNDPKLEDAVHDLDEDLEDLYKMVNKLTIQVNKLTTIVSALTGFSSSRLVSVSFSAVNTDTVVAHTLGVAPTHILQIRPIASTRPGEVYIGSSAPTSTQVTLRSTIAGDQAVMLFA